MNTNKIIKIVVAVLLFLAALTTAVWYAVDGDPTTNPNVEEVIQKGKDVVDAVKSDNAAAPAVVETAKE